MVNPNTFSLASWWSELNHFGQTLHAGLASQLPLAEPPASAWAALAEALPDFRAWLELGASKREKDPAPLHRWLDAVLEGFLGHSPQDFLKHSAIGEGWKVVGPDGRALKPERLLRLNPPGEEHALPIFLSFAPLNQKDGRRRALDLDRFLRAKQLPMGIITDGRSLRWVVAGTHQNAFTQWDLLALWREGEAKAAWRGLYTLFGRGQGWRPTPEKDRPHQLGLWLLESSQMQGDLSTSLGEQIREAVEALVHAFDRWAMDDPARLGPLAELQPDPTAQNQALYTAAVRLVMRLVVLAFAESRDLLPTTFPAYRESYGLEALWQRLKRAKNEAGFEHQHAAWMQLLALFRLVHDGSAHPDLALRAYGGDLFRPGDAASPDPVSRALALWESADGVPVSDRVVLRILTLLKQTTVRVNGKAFATPVDFSSLSTEYIGLLYEGLLDYDLRTAAEPMLLLNLGQQPLLPLSLLQAKTEKELKDLLETLSKEKATKASAGEEDEGDGAAGDEDEDTDAEEASEPEGEGEAEAPALEAPEEDLEASTPTDLSAQAWAWAAEAARLLPSRFGLGNLKRGQSKAQKPANLDTREWEERLQRAARSLVARVIPQGERYLIRWSGTRKGSGTFYTRPALTEPLIRETLRPLCFEADGTPKTPEVILSLRVVDPAMGSASFLVGALRYLTEALYDSLVHHRFQKVEGERLILTLPFGLPAVGSPGEDLPPVHPSDPDAEPKLKQRLKRHVVERCLYGVDLNPLAVELAKLAVWVETLDRNLPFGFLDHKLQCGNALVGCWLDRVDEYPLRAWEREGGDGKEGLESKAFKNAFAEAKARQGALLQEALARRSAVSLGLTPDHPDPSQVLPQARQRLASIHNLPLHDAEQHRARWQQLLEDPAIQALHTALDRWCALFFWPGLDEAGRPLQPQELPMPDTWQKADFRPQIQQLAARHRFFHWELAFPELFTGPDSGFDAVLGNPPWEVSKPNSSEFFTPYDPIFRTYKTNKAKEVMAQLFQADRGLEERWNRYRAGFKAMTGWVAASPDPFQASLARGKQGATLAEHWARQRQGRPRFSDPAHPFRLQGSADLNTYKLFLEQARALLRPGGRLGFVVPSGLYTDAGAKELRDTFLTQDHWELLYGFENRRKIFQIDSRFKFVLTVLTKGRPDPQRPLQAAFMRLDTGELATPRAHTLPVTAAQVRRFSPNTLSFMELRSPKDLDVAQKLYGDHPLLGDLGLSYRAEFHMTNDAKLWKDGSRAKLEAAGLLAPLEDTRDIRVRFRLWKAGWVPLMEGKHFWQFNPYYLGNDTENGLKKFLEGQRFIPRETLRQVAEDQWQKAKEKAEKDDEPFDQTVLDFMPWVRPRLVFRDVAASTNKRTFIACLGLPGPHGNKSPDIAADRANAALSGLVNSHSLDWVMRRKISTTLNKFYIETLPVPKMSAEMQQALASRAWRLMGVSGAAVADPADRLRLRLELDALVAHAYGLTEDAFAHILLDTECGAVGFGKTDANLPAAHRQPRLTLDAYRQLLDKGLDRFLQDGAEIPEAALVHRRPLIEIWSPADGWDTAWAEAEAMADSDHEWDLFLGKEHAVQAEYGNSDGDVDMAASSEHGKDPYRVESQPGALFDPDEFRQDGQRRLL